MAKLGIQLYTVRDAADEDYFGTIKRLREMGYDGIEFPGGTMERASAGQLKGFLDEIGFELAGIVFDEGDLQSRFNEVLKYCIETKCPTAVHPYMPKDYLSPEGLQRFAENLNNWGRKFEDCGISLLYHVHGHEFEKFDGKYGMDSIIERLTNAKLEIDVYWVEHAGVDSVQFVRKYAGISPCIHFKDMKDLETKEDVEVGDGCIDMAEIARLGRARGAKWFIVEQEQFTMPSMASAEISCRNMRRICF